MVLEWIRRKIKRKKNKGNTTDKCLNQILDTEGNYIYICSGPYQLDTFDKVLDAIHDPFNPLLEQEVELEGAGDYLATIEHAIQDLEPHSNGTDVFVGGNSNNNICGEYVPIKKHPLDIKYPHQCFKCGRDLNWKELLDRNINFIEKILIYGFDRAIALFYKTYYEKYKHLKELWRSKVIQFYCCNCYNKLQNKEES